MSQQAHRSAIVIGGSIAGLLAARVLSDHFNQVTIVERDRIPVDADPRAGVPQGYHLHALLVRGRQIMEGLFPGLEDDLLAHGTLKLDTGRDAHIRFKTGWAQQVDSGLHMFSMSRPLLEGRVRSRVMSNSKVTVREGYDVLSLVTNDDKSAVAGIQVRQRGTQQTETLYADLVVDASGRATKTPEWLETIGYEKPQETAINAFVGYTTRWYEIPADVQVDGPVWIQPVPPALPRGGIFAPIEGNRWQVTLFGIGKDYPPTDEDGFMAFARSLASSRLYNMLQKATPISPIYGYRNTINRMHHYDKLKRFPEGLMVIGDAYTHFNPTYAQGMTVAALSADALADVLRKRNGNLVGLGREFQKRAAKAVAPAWQMTTTEDLRWETTEGGSNNPMTRFMQWYTGEILGLIPKDVEVYKAFLPVQHMVVSGTSLMSPRIFAKVIKNVLNRRKNQAPQPIYGTQEFTPVSAQQ